MRMFGTFFCATRYNCTKFEMIFKDDIAQLKQQKVILLWQQHITLKPMCYNMPSVFYNYYSKWRHGATFIDTMSILSTAITCRDYGPQSQPVSWRVWHKVFIRTVWHKPRVFHNMLQLFITGCVHHIIVLQSLISTTNTDGLRPLHLDNQSLSFSKIMNFNFLTFQNILLDIFFSQCSVAIISRPLTLTPACIRDKFNVYWNDLLNKVNSEICS